MLTPRTGAEYRTSAGYTVRVLCTDRPNEFAAEQCAIVMDLEDGYCMEMNMQGEAFDAADDYDDEDPSSMFERQPDYDLSFELAAFKEEIAAETLEFIEGMGG